MTFKSILSDIGHGLEKFFSKAVPLAQDIEPFVDAILPGFASLYNSTVAEVAKAESLAVAASQQNGTGAQKLAIAVAGITPTVLAYAKAQGLPEPSPAHITALVNGVVDTLNALPAAAAPAAPIF